MEYEEFSPLDNTLIDDNIKNPTYAGSKRKIENIISNFEISNDKGLVTNIEKVIVLRNGEWDYDTYIKSNKTIDKRKVKRFISKIEKDYEIQDINYEFYGGPPMGTLMLDPGEITGDNVWVINLKPKLFEYLKKQGKIGNLEDMYNQIGGGLWNNLKKQLNNVNSIVIDTINNFFFI